MGKLNLYFAQSYWLMSQFMEAAFLKVVAFQAETQQHTTQTSR